MNDQSKADAFKEYLKTGKANPSLERDPRVSEDGGILVNLNMPEDREFAAMLCGCTLEQVDAAWAKHQANKAHVEDKMLRNPNSR